MIGSNQPLIVVMPRWKIYSIRNKLRGYTPAELTFHKAKIKKSILKNYFNFEVPISNKYFTNKKNVKNMNTTYSDYRMFKVNCKIFKTIF